MPFITVTGYKSDRYGSIVTGHIQTIKLIHKIGNFGLIKAKNICDNELPFHWEITSEVAEKIKKARFDDFYLNRALIESKIEYEITD